MPGVQSNKMRGWVGAKTKGTTKRLENGALPNFGGFCLGIDPRPLSGKGFSVFCFGGDRRNDFNFLIRGLGVLQ